LKDSNGNARANYLYKVSVIFKHKKVDSDMVGREEEKSTECETGQDEQQLIYTGTADPAILRRLDKVIELLVQIHEAVRI